MPKIIHLIAAARPNFMKVAPLFHALKKTSWATPVLIHTGQHYDVNMSDAFFVDLQLPEPDIHLGVGSGSHAEQTGQVMVAYEKVVTDKRPDLVVVVGDVNSTVACTLATAKVAYAGNHGADEAEKGASLSGSRPVIHHRPLIAHLEAGLRSFDRSMPEEINRLATDALSDILWTPSPDADENLFREGVPEGKIVRVGNIMIDSLEMLRQRIEEQTTHRELGMNQGDYGVVTLHRPANVDNPEMLRKLCDTLVRISRKIPLVFPVHPRTRKNLESTGLIRTLGDSRQLVLLEPQSYIRFMSLVFNCRLVITDSGGIQEETTYLGIPCLTMRPNTERPITVTEGTNQLCRLDEIEQSVETLLSTGSERRTAPALWDGKTAFRVVESIRQVLGVGA